MENRFDLRAGSVALSRLKVLRIMTISDQSQVYATQDTITGILYTLKLTRSLNESRVLKLVGSHPNVVSIFRSGMWLDTAYSYLVLDTCQGNLQSHIIKSHEDSTHFLNADCYIVSTFVQILDALEFCHLNGVYHRDLKPANIFVCDGGRVRLANFDLAFQTARCKDFGTGTEAYMAPECWPERRKTYHPAPSDVWSLGVILINLVCHRYPWTRASSTDDGYIQYRRSGQSLSVALSLSPQLNHILNSIFQHNPENRISIPELREMIVDCSELRRRESVQLPLDLTSEKALLSDGTRSADERPGMAQTPQYYDTGDLQQMGTTDWYQLSIHSPVYPNCGNGCSMVLCDSDLYSRSVEETYALYNAPHVWTDFAEDVDAVDRLGLQVSHGAAV